MRRYKFLKPQHLVAFFVLQSIIPITSTQSANALALTATGTSATICNQNVDTTTGVTAERLSGGDCLIQFKSAGTTVVWTVPTGATSIQYLVVAGGGSGTRGLCAIYWGQGGGGGEVLAGTKSVSPGATETIKVGKGGARSGNCSGASTAGNAGETSTLTSISARPGQPGNNITTNNAGKFGGISGNLNAGGTGTANGSACGGTSLCGTGGGGGAGGVGNVKNGGAGGESLITGSSVKYGGGGAGKDDNSFGTAIDGGAAGSDATDNLGGGGSDSSGSAYGTAGGSGIVVLRYTPDSVAPTYSSSSIATTGTSLTLTYSETLSATTAAASSFTVSRSFTGLGTDTITISSVATSGSDVTLNLSSTIYAGDTVTVTYVDPTAGDDANAVQDIAGNDAISISNQAITNNSTQKRTQTTLTLSSTTLAYGSTLRLVASGGSGAGAVSYAVTNGNCIISNIDSLTASSTGTCLVTATKAADNNYLVTNSSSATITVSSSGTSATISVDVGVLTFRTYKSITATPTVAGKLTFKANKVVIAGCKNLVALANVAKSCNYRPNSRGYVIISVTLIPTDAGYTSATSSSDRLFVYQRTGRR